MCAHFHLLNGNFRNNFGREKKKKENDTFKEFRQWLNIYATYRFEGTYAPALPDPLFTCDVYKLQIEWKKEALSQHKPKHADAHKRDSERMREIVI